MQPDMKTKTIVVERTIWVARPTSETNEVRVSDARIVLEPEGPEFRPDAGVDSQIVLARSRR